MNKLSLYKEISRITTAVPAGNLGGLITISALTLPLKEDDFVWMRTPRGDTYKVQLTGSSAIGDTVIRINVAASGTGLPSTINGLPVDSAIMLPDESTARLARKQYTTIHINAFFSGNDINYSFLGYGGHYNFNIGTTAMTDGGTKGNNFGTKWSWFTALRDCVIEETNIVYSSANNSAADDAIFQLWKWTPNIDSSSVLTTNLIKTHNLIGNSNVNYVQKITDTITYNLSQNEQLVPCFQNTDKANIQWNAEIEILISYYP